MIHAKFAPRLLKSLSRKMNFAVQAVAVILLSGAVVFSAQPAVAKACEDSFLGIPAWYNYLPSEDVDGKCSPVLEGSEGEQVNSLLAIGIAVLEALLVIGAYIAVVMIIWGAFNFITSDGSPDKASSARKTVTNTLIGFVIVLVASQVVGFIGRTIGS